MIKAFCTWGSAGDVSIITDSKEPTIPVMVFEKHTKADPLNSITTEYYQTVNDVQIPLTADQAIDLGAQLIKAGLQAKRLDDNPEDFK
jgi:hypothetical protein